MHVEIIGLCILILVVGLVSVDVFIIPLLAVPASLIVTHVGGISSVTGGASSLSVADSILALATFLVLPFVSVRGESELRGLLGVLGIYEAIILLTVVDNPYRADIVEWLHEALLVGGSLVVGFTLSKAGRAIAAVRAFVLGACLLAIIAAVQCLRTHLAPASLPGGFQKNAIGDLVAFAVFVTYVRPNWLGSLSRRGRRYILALCLVGILSSQSRQAIIGLAVALAYATFESGRAANKQPRRIPKAAIAAAVLALLAFSYVTISHEIASSNKFNSVYQRLSWYSDSLQVWRQSRWFGVGLRWWYTTRFPVSFQPPNAEMEMLTSAGLVGLGAFIILIVGAFVILRRLPAEFRVLAVGSLMMRVVQGQLDIFWVTAQGSLPWILVGIAVGADSVRRRSSRVAITSLGEDALGLSGGVGPRSGVLIDTVRRNDAKHIRTTLREER